MTHNMPDDIPENVRAVVAAASALTGIPAEEFFVRGHEHEELPEGAYSIAYEGWVDFNATRDTEWPFLVSNSQHEGNPYPGLFLEPLTSWGLGVFPKRG